MLKINKKSCPECGKKMKNYYHSCYGCGCEDIVDWGKTIIILVVYLSLLGGAWLYISSIIENLGSR